MKELIKATKKFDNFLKMQLYVIFIISMSWSLILPLITKLQGLLWATSIISIFLILTKLTAFIAPRFKNIKLHLAYRNLIILDGLYLLSLSTYFISPLLFLYVEGVLMLIYTIIMSVFGIRYDAFLMKKYDITTFENVQYAERISMATASIIGYSIVVLLDLFTNSISTVLYVFIIILLINLLMQIYNYIFYWKRLNIGN